MKSSRAFSLVELIVVLGIIAIISGTLFLNFRSSSKNATARIQVANAVESDIRRAQSMAIAGTGFNGQRVCGFGIHYVNTQNYLIYARPLGAGSCKDDARARVYSAAADQIVERKALINQYMAFQNPFQDIYFELPNPTTYLNGDSSLDQPPQVLTIVLAESSSDFNDSTVIYVFASGKIDINNQ